jgi:hypothetical protein
MTVDVTVMGTPLTLRPISTGQLIELFGQFPVLIELLGGPGANAVKTAGPVALAHVIATSTGEGNNPAAIERASQLSVGKVAEIIERIMEITFEDGTGNFMKRIKIATQNVKTLMSEDSSTESSAPWSASLTGDVLSLRRSKLHRVN